MNYQATREIKTFDVDTFINGVFNKFAGTPNEESREDLQALWDKVLAMPMGGDASLYPNAHGPRPAMLEVWHKAGDFWRAGYRNGDELFCDQYGIVLHGWQITKINEAKGLGLNANIAENAAETPRDDASASGRATAGGTAEVPAESETDASMACEEYGIAIDEETAQRIAAAKATIESGKTPTEAAEAPTAAQKTTSGLSPHSTAETPAEATETPTGETPCSATVSDGSAVSPQPPAETQEEATTTDYDTADDDYDPGVIVPEAAYPAHTPRRRRRTSRYRPSAPLPSLFDDCEITDSNDTPTETPADDEMMTTRHRFAATLKNIAKSDAARELAKGIGIIAALAIIYESGLIIPFALFGGLVGGFIK